MSEEKEEMAAGSVVGILASIATWAVAHSGELIGAVNSIATLGSNKKTKEELLIIEEKLQQVGEAALELNQKIDTEVSQVRTEVETLRQQVTNLTLALEAHQRTTKTTLTIMGAVLSAAIVIISVLVILF